MDYNWASVSELEEKLKVVLDQKHGGFVTSLHLDLEGDTVVITGEVASESCRGDAKRFLLGFEGVSKVRNLLVVAGFLEAASDGDDLDFFGQRREASPSPSLSGGSAPSSRKDAGGAPGHQEAEKEKVEVLRRPTVDAEGDLAPSGWINVSIDLIESEGGDQITISEVDEDWTTLSIAVLVHAPWASEVEFEQPNITLSRAGTSNPAKVRLQVAAEYEVGSRAPLNLSFLHGTRICGHRSIELSELASLRRSPSPPAMVLREEDTIKVLPEASGPGVTVIIHHENGQEEQFWSWFGSIPGGTLRGGGQAKVGYEPKNFADNLLRSCPSLKSGSFSRTMRSLGETLWQAAPPNFHQAYRDFRAALGPDFAIQIITDDPYVPWEFMAPDVSGAGHLYLDHPVARWPLRRGNLMRNSMPAEGRLISFTPTYRSHKALPFADAEGKWLASSLKAERQPCKRDDFFAFVDANEIGPVKLLHFAGHGREDTGLSDGGIEFEDGTVSVTDFDHSGVKLGQRDGTLVVLNACEVSSGGRLLGMNSGWGTAVPARQFGGLIAPLWEVPDAVAFSIVQAALPPILDGTRTLGEAMRAARAAHSAETVAAFAYLAHGDVMARCA